MNTQFALFYQERRDIQIKQSLIQPRADSNASDFIDYLGNSAQGSNYGLELEFVWRPSAMENLGIDGAFSWLDTELADGVSSVDVINKSAGDPDWINLKNIDTVEVVKYSKILFNRPVYNLHIRGKVKYFTHGNYAVELTDKDGLRYRIGSQRFEELNTLINQKIVKR